MYYLGDILSDGFFAHTVMQRAFDRTHEAIMSLDMSVITQNTKDAIIINNLLKGETAAQGRTIYNANQAASMIQTFDYGIDAIKSALSSMNTIAETAASGVYSEIEVAVMQDQFNDQGKLINRIAEDTTFGPYHLLDNTQQNASFYMQSGYSVTLNSQDLSVDTSVMDLQEDASGTIDQLKESMAQALEYQSYLGEQMGMLQSQISLADYQISKTMKYGMHIDSHEMAQNITQEVINSVMADQYVAIQTQGNASTVSLLVSEKTLKEPYDWQF